jgi:hypothetical protein
MYWLINANVSLDEVPGTIGSTLRLLSPALIVLTAAEIMLSLGDMNSEIIRGGFGLDLARRKFG